MILLYVDRLEIRAIINKLMVNINKIESLVVLLNILYHSMFDQSQVCMLILSKKK